MPGGVVTSPIQSHHSSFRVNRDTTLPASYRLPASQLTAVRDQGSFGTCWAHAALASSESLLKTQGVAANPDLSELQLAYYTYVRQNGLPAFDLAAGQTPLNRGGNDYKSMAMMARGSSPVLESQAPYPTTGTVIPPSPAIKPAYTLKETYLAHTKDEWKTLLMAKGALSISYYHDDSAYNAGTASYYLPTAVGNTNHAVTLVGWDDNYPASRFAQTPSGNGAWIVKNSWGTYWGENGCFYLSYYSADTDAEAVAFELMAPVADEREYTYTDLGWLSSIGYSSDTGWMKGVYTAVGEEALTTVATFAVGDNTAYRLQINIYNEGTGAFDPAWSEPQAGTIAMAGYARIGLNNPVLLSPGQKYEVIVGLTVPGETYPLPIETAIPGYSSQVTSAAGQTYLSPNGTNWGDFASYGYEACLYAFTDTTPGIPSTVTVTFDSQGGSVVDSQTVDYNGLVTEPANPTWTGHTFGGWYKQAACTTAWDFATDRVTAATTIFAKWTTNAPTIYAVAVSASNSAWGTVSGGGNYTAGATATVKATPKAGYRFVRWLEGSTAVSTSASYAFPVTKARTLKAEFAAITTPVLTVKTTTTTGATLSWTAVAGATGYEVYRDGVRVDLVTGTTYTAKGLSVGKAYLYKIRARCAATMATTYSAYSTTVVVRPLPAAPTGVKAASAGYSSAKVSWNAVAGATKYQVYLATSASGSYTYLGETSATNYTSSGLTTGKTYYYKVRAYAMVGTVKVTGAYSAVVSAKPVPATPTGVKAARISDSSLKVSWSAVSGTTKYQLYRATSRAGAYTKVGETTSLSYTNTGLTDNKTYYYKVRAYRTVSTTKVYGAYSAIVYAKP